MHDVNSDSLIQGSAVRAVVHEEKSLLGSLWVSFTEVGTDHPQDHFDLLRKLRQLFPMFAELGSTSLKRVLTGHVKNAFKDRCPAR